MLTPEENDLLCRIEDGRPMGSLMRRHWIPICLSEEIPEVDGAPVKARIFGEDLVVFRDTNGRIGVLDERCPHRGVSLVLGRNEDCGLRCLYHGWKMDVDGNVVETPSEPKGSGLGEKVKHRAYPAREWGGSVWAYMGPRETMVEFRPPPWAPSEGTAVSIAKVIIPCNWAQVLEGAIDSSHSSSLHSSDMVPARVDGAKATGREWLRPSTDKSPRMQVQGAGYGFRYAAIRRPITNAATHEYVRTAVFVAPWTVLIPPNDRYNVANVNVPIDDTHTLFYFIAWGSPGLVPETDTWRRYLGQTVGIDLDRDYRPWRSWDNRFGQDRHAMKAGNFTGIKGFPNQDIAMWTTMDKIADRSRDRLGASDVAVVQFRRQMVEAVQSFSGGARAIGTEGDEAPADVCAFQLNLPKSVDWREHPAQPVWQVTASGGDNQYLVRG